MESVKNEVSVRNTIFAKDYAHDYLIQIKTQRNSLWTLDRHIPFFLFEMIISSSHYFLNCIILYINERIHNLSDLASFTISFLVLYKEMGSMVKVAQLIFVSNFYLASISIKALKIRYLKWNSLAYVFLHGFYTAFI